MLGSRDRAVERIFAERLRQDQKFGRQSHGPYCWLAILTEEVGEAAQAALHDRFGGSHAGTLREEVTHVAAVALAWLENMERDDEVEHGQNGT